MNSFPKDTGTDSENKKVLVYYEVEPIFLNTDDKIPIGTRIFAFRDTDTSDQVNNFISQSKKKDEFKITLPYHVFIPNYIEDYEVEKGLKVSEIAKDFRMFYAGDIESISKWYSHQNTSKNK